MFKKAFTMVELVVALLLVAILAAVTIGIAKNKMTKIDKYSYYIAYSTMQDIAANIISQSDYDFDGEDLAAVSIYDGSHISKNMPKYLYLSAFAGIQTVFGGLDRRVAIEPLTPSDFSGAINSTDYAKYEYTGYTCHKVHNDELSGEKSYLRDESRCPSPGGNYIGSCLWGAPGAINSGSKVEPFVDQPNYGSYISADLDKCAALDGCGFYCFKYPKNNVNEPHHPGPTMDDGSAAEGCVEGQYKDSSGNCKNCADITTWAEYKNVLSQCPAPSCERFGMVYNEEKGTCVAKNTAEDLCKRIKAEYNISGSACDITAATMSAGVANGFSAQTPHIKLSNGTNLYIASDLVKLEELSDAADKRDRIAYLVYVDVNGSKKGKGVLYQDVFPFYLTMSGKVIPAYSSTVSGGGNSAEHLSLNIVYDDYTESGNRVVKAEKTNLDYVTAACETGYIRSAKYCGTKTPLDICSDPQKDCRFIVNKPMKFFR